MGIIDLSSFTSKQGVTTSVWLYDEADTFVVQHEFLHISFFREDFKEFVETLIAALRKIERLENPVNFIHPVIIRPDGGKSGENVGSGAKSRVLLGTETES